MPTYILIQTSHAFEEQKIMAKHLVIILLIMLVVVAMLPPTVIANDTPTYAARGPYPVGTLELTIEDAQRPLNVTVWYPALNPENLVEEATYWASPPPPLTDPLPITGHALADAAPDTLAGPYPLVIFSHGLWGFRHNSVYLTEHLASYGLVVMALDHSGDTLADMNNADTNVSHLNRPQDISRLIDFAENQTTEGGVLNGVIDVDQIAVIGHSFGGYTALAVAGARLHFEEFDELFCQDPDFMSRDYGSCGTLAAQDRLAQAAGLSQAPAGLWPSFRDERVDAIVPLAAAQTTLFGNSGLEDVTIPALFMVGSADLVPPEYYTYRVYEHISSERKSLVTFVGAGHTLFVNACAAMPWQTEEAVCSDPAWDMSQAHDLVNHFVTAFCLAELYGDKVASAALNPGTVQFDGIGFEAIGY
jgi:predicted dienelactone hydrolase